MVYAIVVTDPHHYGGNRSQIALVVTENMKSERDFQCICIETDYRILQNLIDPEKSKISSEKTLECVKRGPKLYGFGEVLEFDESLVADGSPLYPDIVTTVPNLYETRIHNDETQILLPGVMSRSRRYCWMFDSFPNLTIPAHLRHTAIPNVAMKMWVNFQVRPNMLIKYELSEFVSVDPTSQMMVKSAEWNGKMVAIWPDIEASAYDDILWPWDDVRRNSTYLPRPSMVNPIADRGIVVSRTDIICKQFPDFCFKKVVHNEFNEDLLPPTGSHVVFHADWLAHLGFYSISSARIDHKCDLKPIGVSANGHIRTTIRIDATIPGFFRSEALGIYVDDPSGVLDAWQFSKYRESGLAVAIAAGAPGPTGKSRYYVTEITDKKAEKLEPVYQSGEMVFKKEQCTVIERGVLHFAKYPHLSYRNSPEIREFEIGAVLKASAHYEAISKEWIIDELVWDQTKPQFEVQSRYDTRLEKFVKLFLVKVMTVPKMPYSFQHEVLGLIQPPLQYYPEKGPTVYTYDEIWVARNSHHANDALSPPFRLAFHWFGELPPDPFSPETVGESDENDGESIVTESSATSSSKRVRFAENLEDVQETSSIKAPPNAQVEQKADELLGSHNYKKNPENAIRFFIEDHERVCPECRCREQSDCPFVDVLATIMERDISTVVYFGKFNFLNFVIARRFGV